MVNDDCCPICLDPEAPRNHAVEWDNGEPAPGSGKYGMSVCATCQKGVDGEITPWEWVRACIIGERSRVRHLEQRMERVAKEVAEILERV